MKAREVQPGDRLLDHTGRLLYTVDTVTLIDSTHPDGLPLVVARVCFAEGGDDIRCWKPGQEVNLIGGPRIDNGIA